MTPPPALRVNVVEAFQLIAPLIVIVVASLLEDPVEIVTLLLPRDVLRFVTLTVEPVTPAVHDGNEESAV